MINTVRNRRARSGLKLDIGELTTTIRGYENFIKILSEQKENINKAVKELTDLGWSGAAKDKFLENHTKKQQFYTKLEEDFQYMKGALEHEEKPRAFKLKKQSEDFVNRIKRSAGGAALTSDDAGIISLQYEGKPRINKNVDECTNNYYKKMNSKFVEILSLVNNLSFTSFPITGDIAIAENSLKNQTTSLTGFNDLFNEYCAGVGSMEDNICSVFGKISGVTEGISKFRNIFVILENGQVDKNRLKQLMLKNPGNLTAQEKQMLEYAKILFGEDECKKIRGIPAKHSGPNVEEAAAIAEDVYFENYDEAVDHDLPGGWQLIDHYSGGSSLQIGVYARVGPDGKVEYVIANRGSRDPIHHVEDWKTNAKQAFGKVDDIDRSLEYVENFIKNNPHAKITYVGHSKGGAEAAANAVDTKKDAILFNPAAANLKAYGLNSSDYHADMTSYVVDGEILNDIEGPVSRPIDKEVHLHTKHEIAEKVISTVAESVARSVPGFKEGVAIAEGKVALDKHYMKSVKEAIKQAKKEGRICEGE